MGDGLAASAFAVGVKNSRRIRTHGLNVIEDIGADGTGSVSDRLAIEEGIVRCAAASNGDPCDLIFPRDTDYKIDRPASGAGSTEGVHVRSNVVLRGPEDRSARIFLDPATATGGGRYFLVRFGLEEESCSSAGVFGLTVQPNQIAISGGSTSGDDSKLGIAAHHQSGTAFYSEHIRIGNVSVLDSRIAIGARKDASDDPTTGSHTQYGYDHQHRDWRCWDIFADQCTNKMVEVGETRDFRMENFRLLRCETGPQVIYYANDVRFINGYVEYINGGVRLNMGVYDVLLRDIEVVANLTETPVDYDDQLTDPNNMDPANSWVYNCAVIFDTEPDAGSPEMRDITLSNVRAHAHPTRNLAAAVRYRSRTENTAADFHDIDFQACLLDGDVAFQDPIAPAKSTFSKIRHDGATRVTGQLVTVAYGTGAGQSRFGQVMFDGTHLDSEDGHTLSGNDFELRDVRIAGDVDVASGATDNVIVPALGSPGSVTDGGTGTITGYGSLSVPDQVTGVAATMKANGAALTWNPAARAESYEPLYREDGATDWIAAPTVSSLNQAATILGLTASTAYEFAVRAVNGVGNGPPSATLDASTIAFSTPADLLGVGLWLKADAIIASDSDPVSVWPESSGSLTVAQATSGKQPVYRAAPAGFNSEPAVEFDGSDDFLSLTNGLGLLRNKDGAAVFVVAKTDSNSVAQTAWSLGINGIAMLIARLNGVAGQFGGQARRLSSDGSLVAVNGGTINTANAFVQELILDYATAHSISQYINGNANGSATTLTTGNSENSNATAVNIGAGITGLSGFFDGHIAEIVVINHKPTTTERSWVRSYLGTKYAITVV